MAFKLSEGAIEAIMKGENPEKPIVQLLNHKKISNNSTQDRYRVIISDGKYFNSYAMLATQLNDKVVNGELTENTIISLDQYVPSKLPNQNAVKKVLVIVNLTVLVHGSSIGAKIGNPKLYDEFTDNQPESTAQSSTNLNNSDPTPKINQSPGFSGNKMLNNSNANAPKNILPIAGINPYNRWIIKGRVVNKSNIRTWSNARGEGKLFSVDFVDESGGIRATAFNDQCMKFFDMLELNKVYFVSRSQVKTANKKFSTLPHEYELTFTNDTQIVECTEDTDSIPQVQYNFTPLCALKDIAADSFVDILGICKSFGDIQNLTARASKRELKKREITLVDQTDASITVCLWGNAAEEFDGSSMPVIAIKGGRISEFGGGKSVSLGVTSSMQINPDIPKAHQLRGWYDSLTNDHQFSNISNRTVGEGGNAIMWTLKEALLNQVGTRDNADYFNVEATVLFIQSDRALYHACPNKDCKKKVIDQNNGTYRCEKCNEEFQSFEYRLMLSLQICDWTGSQWISMFQDQAEELLGATATEIGQSRDAYNGNYDSYFRKPLFKNFVFRLRAKMDTFNNETRLKMTAVNVKKIDYKESCKRLIEEMKRLSGVAVNFAV